MSDTDTKITEWLMNQSEKLQQRFEADLFIALSQKFSMSEGDNPGLVQFSRVRSHLRHQLAVKYGFRVHS